MSSPFPVILLLSIVALLSLSASAQEVAYAYSESGGRLLDSGNITQYNGTDIVTFSVAASPGDLSTTHVTRRSIDSIKDEINLKINKGNDPVRDKGLTLIGNMPGPRKVDQICAIYDYLVDKKNWTYVDNWIRLEQFQYSNYTLAKGQEVGGLGKGDCDDFAILLAALIESVGGTPRIIFAYGPDGGHAYAEVLLGNYSGEDGDVDCMLRWLRLRYNVEEVNTQRDLSTGDVWLNLDWWREPDGAKHPGGPFFSAARQVQVYPENDASNTYLNPVNVPPEADFSMLPLYPNAGDSVVFNASSSRDECGHIVSYRWEFGDGSRAYGMIVSHAYLGGGTFRANLTISDNDETYATYSRDIVVNRLPVPEIRYYPDVPEVGENITFDASASKDEDGQVVEYYWELGDGMNSTSKRYVHRYDKRGIYAINLSVFDDKGAGNETSKQIRINERPDPKISISPDRPNAGEEIMFDASMSSDPDGTIKEYTWDFGDGSAIAEDKVSTHAYKMSKNYTVKLIIIDNDNATNESSSLIKIGSSTITSLAWLKKGDELLGQGRCDEAIAAYNKSYALDPNRTKALFGKGKAFYAKGEYGEALLLFTAAIEQGTQYELSNSEYADMWIYRANALKKLDRDDEADAAFDQAENLDPSRHPDLVIVIEPCHAGPIQSANETALGP